MIHPGATAFARIPYDSNLKGPVYVVLETLNDLKMNRGTIVNIASNAGVGTAAMNTTFYSVSKAALIMLTKKNGPRV